MATALLHSAIVAEKRDALKSWTVLLAILGFSLSLMGTFLVRSGMLTSVHSCAADPERGLYILGFLVVVVGGSLTLYAWRAPSLRASGRFRPISREGALVINNLLLVTGCATVFIGTLYPLVLDAISGVKVSVGPPFFESSFVWIIAPLLILAAAGPLMAWKRADLPGVSQRLIVAFAVAAIAAILLVVLSGGPWGAILGLTIAAWLIGGVAAEFFERLRLFRVPLRDSLRRARVLPRSAWGMSLAEILTCVREQIPVTAVVFNNGQWGAEKRNQIDYYDNRFVGTNLDNPSFAEIARAMGADGHRIDRADQVGDALREAAASDRPTVLEILVGKELAEPFRRDALHQPVRLLEKYKAYGGSS